MGQSYPSNAATAAQVAALPTTASLASQSNVAIKSIQRGIIGIPNGSTSATATITSVNTSKTELRYLGYNYASTNIQSALTLTNSTTVTASLPSNAAATFNVYWELTEYY
jgi:hypothetical protein